MERMAWFSHIKRKFQAMLINSSAQSNFWEFPLQPDKYWQVIFYVAPTASFCGAVCYCCCCGLDPQGTLSHVHNNLQQVHFHHPVRRLKHIDEVRKKNCNNALRITNYKNSEQKRKQYFPAFRLSLMLQSCGGLFFENGQLNEVTRGADAILSNPQILRKTTGKRKYNKNNTMIIELKIMTDIPYCRKCLHYLRRCEI